MIWWLTPGAGLIVHESGTLRAPEGQTAALCAWIAQIEPMGREIL